MSRSCVEFARNRVRLEVVATGKQKKETIIIKGVFGLWPGGLLGVNQAQHKMKESNGSFSVAVGLFQAQRVTGAHIASLVSRVSFQ